MGEIRARAAVLWVALLAAGCSQPQAPRASAGPGPQNESRAPRATSAGSAAEAGASTDSAQRAAGDDAGGGRAGDDDTLGLYVGALFERDSGAAPDRYGDGTAVHGSPGFVHRDVGGDAAAPVHPQVVGLLDRDQIRAVVRAGADPLRRCYADAGAPGEGRVVLRWDIGPDGRVTSAVVAEAPDALRAVAECMAREARAWQFPQPRGGGIVRVTYPFVLARE